MPTPRKPTETTRATPARPPTRKTAAATSPARAERPAPKKAPARAKRAAAKGPAARAKLAAAEREKYGRRADLNTPVDAWVAKLPGATRTLVEQLRSIVRAAVPEAQEAIKWGMPTYSLNGMFCYIRHRPAYAALGFFQQGTTLQDPGGRLEGSGKAMRHCKVRSPEEIDVPLFTGWVKEAARLTSER